MMWFLAACSTIGAGLGFVLTVGADHTPSLPAGVDAAVTKSLPLLQASARTWTERRDCASCHHQALGSIAAEVARERGFVIDPIAAHQQALFTRTARDEGASVDAYVRGQGVTSGGSVGLSYSLTGLASVREPADQVTDVLTHFIAGRQFPDGSFPAPGHRPPHEDGEIPATALAIRALLAYGQHQPGLPARVERAAAWLGRAKAVTTEDRAMQLLGLRWANAAVPLTKTLHAAILGTQRPDGGWAQIETLGSDAYSTGQILVALNQTGFSTESKAYRNGVAYLLRTQLPDGSWHVRSRRRDEISRGQDYFETGFPHGRDQFISYAGSAWATMALCLTRSPGTSPALTDSAARERREKSPDTGWTNGTTPLMKAALLGSPAAVKALLDSGADPNAANEEGTTALMWASTRGLAWVDPLLVRGANPSASDRGGFTALMVAAGYSGMLPVMSRLISAGAEVNALTTNGWSALRDAVKSGETAKVGLLLDHGAVLLVSPRNSNRMMMLSVTQDDTAMLALLLDRGLPVDLGPGGYTGLMAAASDGSEGLLRLLLARGADPNRVEARGGLTPLMYAALDDPGHDRLVRALLKAGARVETKSAEGLTALDYARKYGHKHLAAVLMSAAR